MKHLSRLILILVLLFIALPVMAQDGSNPPDTVTVTIVQQIMSHLTAGVAGIAGFIAFLAMGMRSKLVLSVMENLATNVSPETALKLVQIGKDTVVIGQGIEEVFDGVPLDEKPGTGTAGTLGDTGYPITTSQPG